MRVFITGGAGFIGSNLVRVLNANGIVPFVADDLFDGKWKNLVGAEFEHVNPRNLSYLNFDPTDVLVHLGANVDTTEPMNEKLWSNNVNYSLSLFHKFQKVIYASSAAVYGAEEKDFTERIKGLKPLNAYGFSKWYLDLSCFREDALVHIPHLYGLRFFNVYGANEVHKEKMQSVISQAINKLSPLYQFIPDEGSRGVTGEETFRLFKSNRREVKDGEQKRDFIYVDDVARVILWFIRNSPKSNIYNLGSGKARTFLDVVKAVNPKAGIQFVNMPNSLENSYQYFTQADLTRLREAGYKEPFTELEEGIRQTMALTFPQGQKE